MKKVPYTNKANLPIEIVTAIMKDRYTDDNEEPFDYSATSLIAPIQMTILTQRHPEKIVIRDVLDYFWMFLGSVAHQCLEEAWHENMGSVVEERMYVKVNGKVIAGKIDCYHNNELRDYKFTKTYKIMKGDFLDWIRQMNIYYWLCIKNGRKVYKMTIYAFLLDWNKHEASKKNYPKHKIEGIDIKVLDLDEIEQYVTDRINKLEEAKSLPDNRLPWCTPHEMWQEVKNFAVVKEGQKRAVRIFETEELAIKYKETHFAGKSEYKVIKRLTERTRCLYHCPASNMCYQHKKLLATELTIPSDDTQPPEI